MDSSEVARRLRVGESGRASRVEAASVRRCRCGGQSPETKQFLEGLALNEKSFGAHGALGTNKFGMPSKLRQSCSWTATQTWRTQSFRLRKWRLQMALWPSWFPGASTKSTVLLQRPCLVSEGRQERWRRGPTGGECRWTRQADNGANAAMHCRK